MRLRPLAVAVRPVGAPGVLGTVVSASPLTLWPLWVSPASWINTASSAPTVPRIVSPVSSLIVRV